MLGGGLPRGAVWERGAAVHSGEDTKHGGQGQNRKWESRRDLKEHEAVSQTFMGNSPMGIFWEVRERVQRKVGKHFYQQFCKSQGRQCLCQKRPRERVLEFPSHRNKNHKIKSRPEFPLFPLWMAIRGCILKMLHRKRMYNLNWRWGLGRRCRLEGALWQSWVEDWHDSNEGKSAGFVFWEHLMNFQWHERELVQEMYLIWARRS